MLKAMAIVVLGGVITMGVLAYMVYLEIHKLRLRMLRLETSRRASLAPGSIDAVEFVHASSSGAGGSPPWDDVGVDDAEVSRGSGATQ